MNLKFTLSLEVPNERTLYVGPVISFFSARLVRSFAGSDPLFNIKTHGVKFENCLCITSRLKL